MDFISAFLLALTVLCLCLCLGGGALTFSCLMGRHAAKKRGKQKAPDAGRQRPGGTDALLTGELILTGLAVTAHMAAVFTGQSFSRCAMLFLVFLGVLVLCSFFLLAVGGFPLMKNFLMRISGKREREKGTKRRHGRMVSGERLMAGIFLAIVLSQLIYLLWNAGIYRQGDMTVETVGSFLWTDGIYEVNPMTGQAYTMGIPTRLKMLCLPTLYAFFCRFSGLTPEVVVTAAVPVWILVSSYAAFSCVGRSLFPESKVKRNCFLAIVAVLVWAGSYFYSMDGFNLLYCGYRGVTVRNLVLMPYLISLCIRKKWLWAVLCILAEACVVWTFYGLGACLLTAAGLFLAEYREWGTGEKKRN